MIIWNEIWLWGYIVGLYFNWGYIVGLHLFLMESRYTYYVLCDIIQIFTHQRSHYAVCFLICPKEASLMQLTHTHMHAQAFTLQTDAGSQTHTLACKHTPTHTNIHTHTWWYQCVVAPLQLHCNYNCCWMSPMTQRKPYHIGLNWKTRWWFLCTSPVHMHNLS